jgi:hypothetical protein
MHARCSGHSGSEVHSGLGAEIMKVALFSPGVMILLPGSLVTKHMYYF